MIQENKDVQDIGIEDLKDAIVFTCEMVNPFLDGYDGASDLIEMSLSMLKLPEAIDGMENIPAEVKDIRGYESDEIDQLITDKLTNLSHEKVIKLKPHIVAIALNLVSVVLVSREGSTN